MPNKRTGQDYSEYQRKRQEEEMKKRNAEQHRKYQRDRLKHATKGK